MNEIVYTLYRVSTIKQVDKIKDDIPMQKEACREFAERMEWTIGKEFLEKGVSGFKISASDRDAIQELKAAFLFSSIMFAVYHIAFIGPSFPWQMLILALVGLTAGGLIFDLIDAKSGNICPSWFVHMFADLSLMTIWYMHI